MTRVLSIVIAVLLAIVGFQAFQIGAYENRVKAIQISHAEEKAKSELEKLNSLIKIAEAKDESIKQAEKRSIENAKAYANAQFELDRLRVETDRIKSTPANCTAAHARIDTLTAVFGECANRLVEMARKADGHLNDALSARPPSPSDVSSKPQKPHD